MLEWITQPEAWIALATLTALEIVLGIDNIIFISILVGRLPLEQRNSARLLGLGLAMGARIALLLCIAWVMSLTSPLFSILGESIYRAGTSYWWQADCSCSPKVHSKYITPWRAGRKAPITGRYRRATWLSWSR